MDSCIREIIEDFGWWINEYDNGIAEIGRESPAGEDFFFSIDNTKNTAEEIRQYYEDFDPEEHAAMWITAKYDGNSPNKDTIPDVHTLVKDADDIDEMLWKLTNAVSASEN